MSDGSLASNSTFNSTVTVYSFSNSTFIKARQMPNKSANQIHSLNFSPFFIYQ